MDEPTPPTSKEPLIRLYPPGPPPGSAPVGRPLPQYVLRDDGKDISDEMLAAPIPESPPHICPICDYNLTGLKQRRCPECGELFELLEARRAGSRTLPRTRQDLAAMRVIYTAMITGMLLFVGSILFGSYKLRGPTGTWSTWPAIAGVIVATWVFMYRVFFGKNQPYMIFIAGVIMATVMAMMLVLAL